MLLMTVKKFVTDEESSNIIVPVLINIILPLSVYIIAFPIIFGKTLCVELVFRIKRIVFRQLRVCACSLVHKMFK